MLPKVLTSVEKPVRDICDKISFNYRFLWSKTGFVVAQGKLSILVRRLRDQGPFYTRCGSTYFYGVKDMSFKYDELHIGLHGFRACSAKTWSISCGLKLVENLVKEVHFHTKNYLIWFFAPKLMYCIARIADFWNIWSCFCSKNLGKCNDTLMRQNY